VQYPNALYHLTSRGVGRNDVFWDDDDRTAFFEIETAEAVVNRYGWPQGITASARSPFVAAIDGWILGSESFASRIRTMVSPQSGEARRAAHATPTI